MSLGTCCISGVKHEGTAIGKTETIGGVPVYVTLPTGTYDKTKAVLFLTDVFGTALPNNLLLADDFARNGYATYLVDYLANDAIPEDALNAGKNFDLMEWVGRHAGPGSPTRGLLDKAVAGLKAQGVTHFAATGYCFGARWVVDLVLDGVLDVAIVAHPSLLKIPEDLNAIKAAKKQVPFLWNTCENDFMFPTEAQATADEVFKGDKNYTRNYYAGCDHGFAVRGDMSIPAIKHGKEDAFKKSIEFLGAHF